MTFNLTAAQYRTIKRCLINGGSVTPHQGRIPAADKRSVNLGCVKRLLRMGLLEGTIELNRSHSMVFATTAGVYAVVHYETQRIR